MIGQRMLSKTPRNQWVKNQSTATTSRGVARARSVMMHGIDQGSSRARRIEVWLNGSVMPGGGSDSVSSLSRFGLLCQSLPHCSCETFDLSRQRRSIGSLLQQLRGKPLRFGYALYFDRDRVD